MMMIANMIKMNIIISTAFSIIMSIELRVLIPTSIKDSLAGLRSEEFYDDTNFGI